MGCVRVTFILSERGADLRHMYPEVCIWEADIPHLYKILAVLLLRIFIICLNHDNTMYNRNLMISPYSALADLGFRWDRESYV